MHYKQSANHWVSNFQFLPPLRGFTLFSNRLLTPYKIRGGDISVVLHRPAGAKGSSNIRAVNTIF